MAAKNQLAENLKRVRDRVAQAALRRRRNPSDITLVAVTKGVPAPMVRQAIELGELDLGESKVQELIDRAGQDVTPRGSVLGPQIRWHMIGHLQRNKVKPALPLVHMIHSVDTLRLAETIDQIAGRLGRTMPVLVEVNCSGESQKFGVAVGAVDCLVEQVATLPNIELRGVMTMASRTDDPEQTRPVFARMREIFDDIARSRKAGPRFNQVSMGMSQDFEVAIEEGATLVRVGSAIFEGA